MERGCLAAVGIAAAVGSSFFVAAAIVEILSGGDGKTSPGVYAGLLVLFGGIMAAGIFLTWRMLRKRSGSMAGGGPMGGGPFAPPNQPPASDADREQRILDFARQQRGRVTIAEVAAACTMTVAESKTALDKLVLLQVAQINVAANGILVYVFPGFLSDDEKRSARDF